MTGEIKRLNERGYGFISGAKGCPDVFFHARDLQGLVFQDLKQGDRVEFGVTQGDKGPRATLVRKAE